MVYTRVLFNNIKEYTPSFIKTVPYAQSAKKVLERKPLVAFAHAKKKANIKFYKFVFTYIMNCEVNYQIFLFGLTFVMSSVFFYPALFYYQHSNKHRQLDHALKIENDYKKSQEDEE